MAREYPQRLDQPRGRRQVTLKPSFDPDAFGRVSETIARFFGTARYLIIQTAIVIVWIALNILVITKTIRWDPYPFILLNLAFSTQAAYAAPLILLAQNRQAERDKVQVAEDRNREELSIATMEYLTREIAPLILLAQNRQAERDKVQVAEDRNREELSIATMEYLTREIASLRMAIGEVATRDYVRGELQSLLKELDERGRELSEE